MGIAIIVGCYFGIGVLALLCLDIITGRIHKKLRRAATEAQAKLIVSGSLVGSNTSLIVVLFALWLFWPVAIYGALIPSKSKEEKNGQKG